MTTAPISYPDAHAVLKQWFYHVKKAGPMAFEMTPSKYAEMVTKLEQTAELLSLHADRVAQRDQSKREG